MGVLIVTDQIEVWRPSRVEDSHGWAETLPMVADVTVGGSLQELGARSYPLADGTGGRGPADPRVVVTARAYVPTSTALAPGDVLTVDGRGSWRVASVTLSKSGVSGGALGRCLVAELFRDPSVEA